MLNIRVDSGSQGLHAATLREDTLSENSVTIEGRRYAVLTSQAEDLPIVLDTLNVLYPGAVTSSLPLPGRVSSIEARLIPSLWAQEDAAYMAKFRSDVASGCLSKGVTPEVFKAFWHQEYYTQGVGEDFDSRVDAAFASQDGAALAQLLERMPEWGLCAFRNTCELELHSRADDPINQSTFTAEALAELDDHVHNLAVGFSGVIALQDAHGIHTVASTGIDPHTPFAIHSVGKVFTGMLALRLIHQGLIPEEVLGQPVQLAPDVISALPASIQAHLREQRPTLRQLMVHKGGLENYLGKYLDAIQTALDAGEEPPQLRRPEDFLIYADDTTVPLSQYHYSNLGILLVGLSLQHLTQTPFDTLLRQHVLEPSGVGCFSSQKPEGAKVNPQDPVAPHICGSPAGGYWTTAADLCQFGTWAATQCKDPTFLRLMEHYGQEFYNLKWEEIRHDGAIPSASAYLISLRKAGVTIAIVSDRPEAAPAMNGAIQMHMLHRTS